MNLRSQQLHERVAKRLKIARLRRDPVCDEFVIKIGSDPTHEEIEQARAFCETAADILNQ